MGAGDTLLVGIGNDSRGDDAAGLEVARRLANRAVPHVIVREDSGDVAELIDSWAGFERVILVDAVRSGSPSGTIRRMVVSTDPLPNVFVRHVSSHGMGVAEAVELSRVLGTLPPNVVVYGIEGVDFEPGDTMTPSVREAVSRVVECIGEELAAVGADRYDRIAANA